MIFSYDTIISVDYYNFLFIVFFLFQHDMWMIVQFRDREISALIIFLKYTESHSLFSVALIYDLILPGAVIS